MFNFFKRNKTVYKAVNSERAELAENAFVIKDRSSNSYAMFTYWDLQRLRQCVDRLEARNAYLDEKIELLTKALDLEFVPARAVEAHYKRRD